jgi:hypothetical protein
MDLQCHLFYNWWWFFNRWVHPSLEYAVIANKFIEAINAKYGSNLKESI